jgi:hypothetical protein
MDWQGEPLRGLEALRVAFAHRGGRRLPRGELWLGQGVFTGSNLEDSLESRLIVCRELGMDMVFLSVGPPGGDYPAVDYRYCGLEEVGRMTASGGIFAGVVVDGPFQRLVQKRGLLPALSSLRRGETAIELREEAQAVIQLILGCLERQVHAVAIAEDIAYQRSTVASPQYLRQCLFPYYPELVELIHARGAYALFHSCGNLLEVIPDLIGCGFDGLAAWQADCLDSSALSREFGAELTLMGGISPELLEADSLSQAHRQKFAETLLALRNSQGGVICSSSGLSTAKHVDRLRVLYQWADEQAKEPSGHDQGSVQDP